MEFTTALSPYRELVELAPARTKWLSCISSAKNKMLSDWTVDQLNIQPYQQIMEIGFGPGHGLELAARKLKVGLLAGIDESVQMYQKAYTKNKNLVRQQLLQLHVGSVPDLSYPHHYFHTIFGSNTHFSWIKPVNNYISLTNMLKTGGKLVMGFQPNWARTDAEVQHEANRVARGFEEAGLIDIQLEFRDAHPVSYAAVTGFKDF
jgi:trans-aconitate methyltransferase